MPPLGREKLTKLTNVEMSARRRQLLKICPEIVPEIQRTERLLQRTWVFFNNLYNEEIARAYRLREKEQPGKPVDKKARIRAMEAKEFLETRITPLMASLFNMEASILERGEELLRDPQSLNNTKTRVKQITS